MRSLSNAFLFVHTMKFRNVKATRATTLEEGRLRTYPAYWWDLGYLTQHINPTGIPKMHAVIHLAGKLDFDRLRHAVHASLYAEPILGYRFKEGFFRPRWELIYDLESATICTIETVSGYADSQEKLVQFMTSASDPTQYPPVRVRIFREKVDTLCVTMDHHIGDGASLKNYVYLLSSLYNKLGDAPNYTPTPNRVSRDLSNVFKIAHVSFDIWSRKPRNKRCAAWKFPEASCIQGQRRLSYRSIDKERVKILSRYARQQRVSSNEVLLAAFFLALRKEVPFSSPEGLCLNATVNLRKVFHAPNGLPPVNFSSGLRLPISASPSAKLSEVTAQVHSANFGALKRIRRGLLPPSFFAFRLLGAAPYWFSKAIAIRMGKSGITKARRSTPGFIDIQPFITNVGNFMQDKVRFDKVEVFDLFVASGIIHDVFGIVVTTYNGTIGLTVLFEEGLFDRSLVEAILDQTISFLPT